MKGSPNSSAGPNATDSCSDPWLHNLRHHSPDPSAETSECPAAPGWGGIKVIVITKFSYKEKCTSEE